MLKSCSYCGGIHKRGYQCPSKPKRVKTPTYIDKFRWSRRWRTKAIQINERDKYLCQICIRKLFNTVQQYNFTDLEVHHIIPIVEDWDKRLEDENLICLCAYHHKMAERGEIDKQLLLGIAKEQERKNAI